MARYASLVALVLVLPSAQAPSQEAGSLYKWVDPQGQVHYSDQPPTGPASAVETHPLPTAPAGQSRDADYYSVENQAKRMEEERRQRDAARSEKEQQRQEEQQRAVELEASRAQAAEEEASDEDGYPVYVVPFRPIRPPHRPRPPVPRPPRPLPAPVVR